MGTEPTLRTNRHSLPRLLLGLSTALGHPLHRLFNASLDLLLVFQLPQLGRDHADHHVLVLGEVLQGIKPAGARGVVLEVEGVDVEFGEQLLGDDVVGARGEVAAADEVAAAEVDAGVEVGGEEGEGLVVELDVGVEELIDGDGIFRVRGVAGAELLGAEV